MILGISCDTPAENSAFRDKFSFPFDLLCDVDRNVSLAYGAVDTADAEYAKRISYLIDSDGKIAKAYATVVPKEHPQQVLDDLGTI